MQQNKCLRCGGQRNKPSNSFLSTLISNVVANAKKPTINWQDMLLGPTAKSLQTQKGRQKPQKKMLTMHTSTKKSMLFQVAAL